MKTNSFLSVISRVIFLIGIIAALFGFQNQGNLPLTYILIIVSIGYLLSGWYLFRGYYPEGHPLLLFIVGYLYSSVFMAFAIVTATWSMASTFIAIAILWCIIQIVMMTVIRKKIPAGEFIQFMIEGSLMLILTIVILISII